MALIPLSQTPEQLQEAEQTNVADREDLSA